jgi:hypothetical protein
MKMFERLGKTCECGSDHIYLQLRTDESGEKRQMWVCAICDKVHENVVVEKSRA